jgi:hypothetical protein
VSKSNIRVDKVSLSPTIFYHSQFKYLQVSIAHTSYVRVSSIFFY